MFADEASSLPFKKNRNLIGFDNAIVGIYNIPSECSDIVKVQSVCSLHGFSHLLILFTHTSNTRITLFKNLVYKNVEAQILEKIRTS